MILKLIIGTIAVFLSAIPGFLAGATIGGNYLNDFTAFQMRGYEATGLIGALVFSVAAAALSVGLVTRRDRRAGALQNALLGASLGGLVAAVATWIFPSQPWPLLFPVLGAAILTEPRHR